MSKRDADDPRHDYLAGIKRVVAKGTAGMAESEAAQFAHLVHGMVGAFAQIRKRISIDYDLIRDEWRKTRGLASWTEERLESIETRLDRLERAAGLPPDPEVEKLRLTLANFRPSVEALGLNGKGMIGDPATFGRPDPKQIAKELGLSVRTVTAALAQEPGYKMAADTREKIAAAVQRQREAALPAPAVRPSVTLYRRGGTFIAQLWDERAGRRGIIERRSTHSTDRAEADRVVASWLADGWGARKALSGKGAAHA